MAFKHVIKPKHVLEHMLLPHDEGVCLQQAWKSHLKAWKPFFSSVQELPAQKSKTVG